MASPTVVSKSTGTPGYAAGTSTVTWNDAGASYLPASRVAGNLLLAFFYAPTNSAPPLPSGWEVVNQETSNNRYLILYARVASADSSDNFAIVRSSYNVAVTVDIYQIGGWYGTIGTIVSGVGDGVDSVVEYNGSTTATPNPAGNTAVWGSGDYLNIISVAASATTTATEPSGYSTATSYNGGSGSYNMLATAYKAFTGDTEDPGWWTLSAAQSSKHLGVIVRPASGASAVAGISRHYARMMTG